MKRRCGWAMSQTGQVAIDQATMCTMKQFPAADAMTAMQGAQSIQTM